MEDWGTDNKSSSWAGGIISSVPSREAASPESAVHPQDTTLKQRRSALVSTEQLNNYAMESSIDTHDGPNGVARLALYHLLHILDLTAKTKP
jgi:hypothetical protein